MPQRRQIADIIRHAHEVLCPGVGLVGRAQLLPRVRVAHGWLAARLRERGPLCLLGFDIVKVCVIFDVFCVYLIHTLKFA